MQYHTEYITREVREHQVLKTQFMPLEKGIKSYTVIFNAKSEIYMILEAYSTNQGFMVPNFVSLQR